MTSGSLTTWRDPGVYRAADGCVMFVLEFDPHGPRLGIVESRGHDEVHDHAQSDFVLAWSPGMAPVAEAANDA